MRIQNLDRICGFLLLGFLVLFFAGHFVFMSSPFVNLESWHAGAARLIYEGKPAEALRYFEQVGANPIGATALIRMAEAAIQVMGKGEKRQVPNVRNALATGAGGSQAPGITASFFNATVLGASK